MNKIIFFITSVLIGLSVYAEQDIEQKVLKHLTQRYMKIFDESNPEITSKFKAGFSEKDFCNVGDEIWEIKLKNVIIKRQLDAIIFYNKRTEKYKIIFERTERNDP